jgi:colanic acid biosynthesis glycosyl transferase WcaI
LKILLLTQYFPPEVGASQTRLYETAQALRRCGLDVEVFTSMPSYPQGKIFADYKGCFYKKEQVNGINVYRIWSYASNDLGIGKRLFSYSSFTGLAVTALAAVKPRPDLVFVESPPLTLGVTGYLLSRVWKCPWILNLGDLWPDSIFALGAMDKQSLAGKSLLKLESFLYKRASGITAVTEGMLSDLRHKKAVPDEKLFYLPNGANVEMFHQVQDFHYKQKQKKFIYAGRIGRAHGAEIIAKAAALTKHRRDICYEIVGDGPELSDLKRLISDLEIDNLTLLDPVPLSQMPQKLENAYAALVTLKDLSLFKGTRPAKMMSPLAAGLPIVYSGAGEGADIVEDTCTGLVTPPEDEKAFAEAIIWLADHPEEASNMGKRGREYAEKYLDWSVLIKKWLQDVQEQIILS